MQKQDTAHCSSASSFFILHSSFFTGPPGEVSQSQLSNDLSNTQNAAVQTVLPLTSNNSNGVNPLGLSVSDPPTPSEVQTLANKLDELINALRR